MSIEKRIYDSDYRRSLAEATRMKIAAAARKLFMEHGYAATSIRAIAGEAGVSEQTVYARFRNKKSIIESIVDEMDTRAGVIDLIEALSAPSGDPVAQIDLIVEFDIRIFEQNLDIFLTAAQASVTEPGLAALIDEMKMRSRAGRARVFEAFKEAGALRPELSVDDANAIFAAMVNPSVYQELVVNAGWTNRRLGALLKSALRHLLIGRG